MPPRAFEIQRHVERVAKPSFANLAKMSVASWACEVVLQNRSSFFWQCCKTCFVVTVLQHRLCCKTSCVAKPHVRLVLCDRRCFDGIVQYHLAEISYLVMCHDDWYNEALIEEDWQSDGSVVQAGYDAFEFMCLSCGVRPGASWLGHDECLECFDEH